MAWSMYVVWYVTCFVVWHSLRDRLVRVLMLSLVSLSAARPEWDGLLETQSDVRTRRCGHSQCFRQEFVFLFLLPWKAKSNNNSMLVGVIPVAVCKPYCIVHANGDSGIVVGLRVQSTGVSVWAFGFFPYYCITPPDVLSKIAIDKQSACIGIEQGMSAALRERERGIERAVSIPPTAL